MSLLSPKIYPEVEILEFYSSRQASLLASMNGLNSESISRLKSIRNYSVVDFVQQWDLELYRDKILSKGYLSFVDFSNSNFFNELCNDTFFLELCKNKCSLERDILNKYFLQLVAENEKFCFVDIGPAGNTCSNIFTSLSMAGISIPSSIAIFLYSTAAMAKNRIGVHEFFTFFNCDGSNSKKIDAIVRTPEIFEIFLTGLYKTTVGYQYTGDRVIPSLSNNDFSSDQIFKLGKVLEGCLYVVNLLVAFLGTVSLDIFTSSDTRERCLNNLFRLIEIPSQDEANFIGELFYDDNGGSSNISKICDDNFLPCISIFSCDEFFQYTRRVWSFRANRNIRWPQGLLTKVDPLYMFKRHLSLFIDSDNCFIADFLLEIASKNINKKFALFGGGKIGQLVAEKAHLWSIELSYVIESDSSKYNNYINGFEVISLEKAKKLGLTNFIVSSVAFSSEITNIIRSNFVGELNIVSVNFELGF